ncbi:hypothetical protein M758_UG213300, partial [Ceratodon purpureus]
MRKLKLYHSLPTTFSSTNPFISCLSTFQSLCRIFIMPLSQEGRTAFKRAAGSRRNSRDQWPGQIGATQQHRLHDHARQLLSEANGHTAGVSNLEARVVSSPPSNPQEDELHFGPVPCEVGGGNQEPMQAGGHDQVPQNRSTYVPHVPRPCNNNTSAIERTRLIDVLKKCKEFQDQAVRNSEAWKTAIDSVHMLLEKQNQGPDYLNCAEIKVVDNEDEDTGETAYYEVRQECLDRVAISLGGNTIFPVASQLLPSFINDGDWKKRHATLITLAQVAKGCAK